MRAKIVGLFEHMGAGNLGDDVSVDAVMQNIKRRWPDTVIYGFSMNPSDSQTRHGIPSYPIRTEIWSIGYKPATEAGKRSAIRTMATVLIRTPAALLRELAFLADSFRTIRSFDFLIISGGGQLLDAWGGPWKFPYTIFKWIVLAKLSRVSCYFLNVGAGPLDHYLSRWFIKNSLRLADYTSFRDGRSRQLLKKAGFSRRSPVYPDCAYGLDTSAFTECVSGRAGEPGTPIIGIAPMAYCDPRFYWKKDKDIYDSLIRELSLFATYLVRHRYRLILFSTDFWFDSMAIEDLYAAVKSEFGSADAGCITRPAITTARELLRHVARMDYVVTCRFHGAVFAHLLTKPVLALSHHMKIATFMDDLGLSEYCIDINGITAEVLVQKFVSLVANRERIRNSMSGTLARYQRELSLQFDNLFPVQNGQAVAGGARSVGIENES